MAFVRPITRLKCGPATVSGTSGLTYNGTGALAAGDAAVAGVGAVGQFGSGALSAQAAQVVGLGGQPPRIISTPSPVFVFGVPSAYPMAQHVDDDYLAGVSYSMSPALTSGLVLDPVSGVLSYDGVGTLYPNDVYTLTATDFTGSDFSGLFNLVGGITIEIIPDLALLLTAPPVDMSQYINDPLGVRTDTSMNGLGSIASYDSGTEELTALVEGSVSGVTLSVTSPDIERTVDFAGAFETNWIADDESTVDGFLVETLPNPQSGTNSVSDNTGTDGFDSSSTHDSHITTAETPDSNPNEGSADPMTPRNGTYCFKILLDKSKDYSELNGSSDDKPRNHLNLTGESTKLEWDSEYYLGFSIFLPSNWEIDTHGRSIQFLQIHAKDSGVLGQLQIWHTGSGTSDRWIWRGYLDDSSTQDDGNPAVIDLGPIAGDIGKWTDFVLRMRWNPFDTTQNPSTPPQSIPDAENATYEANRGILQLWKTDGTVDGEGNRVFALTALDEEDTPVGLVPWAGEKIKFNFREYKGNWKTVSTNVDGPIVSYFDEIYHGKVSNGTTFSDVNPGRKSRP